MEQQIDIMGSIKLLISTYTELNPTFDFRKVFFNTKEEAIDFVKFFYENLSAKTALVVSVSETNQPIFQYEDGYFPFEELELQLK